MTDLKPEAQLIINEAVMLGFIQDTFVKPERLQGDDL